MNKFDHIPLPKMPPLVLKISTRSGRRISSVTLNGKQHWLLREFAKKNKKSIGKMLACALDFLMDTESTTFTTPASVVRLERDAELRVSFERN